MSAINMAAIEALASGAFIFNAIPHIVQGICGKKHMTPFARISSPAINVVWGWINLFVGLGFLKHAMSMPWSITTYACFVIGGFLTSFFLALFWTNPDARLPWHGQ